jgi:DNA-binding NtrC family response regulator
LRERVEDIPLLAEHFLSVYWKRHRDRGTAIPFFSKAAMEELQQREWRGNVRELQNVIEHAVVLLEPGAQIDPEDLPAGEANVGPTNAVPWKEEWRPDFTFRDGGYHAERDRVLGQFELGYLSWLVERAGANMSKAAKIARVDRTTLYRLMERHRLQRDTVIRTQSNG